MPMMPEGMTPEQRIRMLAMMSRSKSPMQFPEVPTHVPDSAPMQVAYDPPEKPQPYTQPGQPNIEGVAVQQGWEMSSPSEMGIRNWNPGGNPFETPDDPDGINTPKVKPQAKYTYRVGMADPRYNGVPRR